MTEFEFTDELDELRASVRAFCTKASPESAVRAAMVSEPGYDPDTWRRLGAELNLIGLSAPEEYGGWDAGLVAHAVTVEELGRALLCGPVHGTIALAVPALVAVAQVADRPDVQVKRLLGDLLTGDRVAALVAPVFSPRFDESRLTVRAADTAEGWRLHGTAGQVPDGLAADVLVVAADLSGGGIGLFVAEPGLDGDELDGDGLERTHLPTLDLTRRQASLRFDGLPATLIAGPDAAPAALTVAFRTAAVLLAAEQLGGAQFMLDRTVEHLKQRVQFGRPLGSFQALKHRCADMMIAVEQARSVTYHAAWAIQDGLDDPDLAVSLAQAVTSDAYFRVAAEAVQLHGGLGFTWEHAAHLYFKRATADRALLGSGDDHLEQLARAVLDRS